MCGVVQGGVTPGLWGYEAGQSGVGDIFAWFADNAVPPRYHEEARAKGIDLHDHLSQLAGEQEVGQHGLIALDWNNGNRSVLVDHELSGLIVGLTLSTPRRGRLPRADRGDRLRHAQDHRDLRGVGAARARADRRRRPAQEPGDHADLRRRHAAPLHLIGSEQGPALGSAMHAAVAAGAYPDIYAAAGAMGKLRRDVYAPDEARAAAYDALYEHYSTLHDHFGRGGDDVMHALRHIRPREVARG